MLLENPKVTTAELSSITNLTKDYISGLRYELKRQGIIEGTINRQKRKRKSLKSIQASFDFDAPITAQQVNESQPDLRVLYNNAIRRIDALQEELAKLRADEMSGEYKERLDEAKRIARLNYDRAIKAEGLVEYLESKLNGNKS
jgi:vacuolar-type H+-ATPase subunit I/STV1